MELGVDCYKFKILELVKKGNLILGLTQENSIESSIQDCLPYILIPSGLYELFLAYPKQPCVCYKVNKYCILYDVILLLSSMSFHVSCNL